MKPVKWPVEHRKAKSPDVWLLLFLIPFLPITLLTVWLVIAAQCGWLK